MRSPAVLVKLFAIFFIILGIVWLACIQMRWEEISPSVKNTAISSGGSVTNALPIARVRSPFAKPYHDISFWAIGIVEIFVAIFYVVAGVFLFKRYVLSKFIVLLVLTPDIFLKIMVVAFMKFGAIPLSHLTHNENMLQVYFMPSDTLYNSFSVIISGLQIYSAPSFQYYLE